MTNTPNDPSAEMAHTLSVILQKVEGIERRLEALDPVMEQAPGMISVATDTLDDMYALMHRSGVDMEERVKQALVLLERLSQPKVMNSLNNLLDNLDLLEGLVLQAPGMTALMVDTVDDLIGNAAVNGVNLEIIARNGMKTVQDSLAAVEKARKEKPPGVFGMLRSLSDPDVQRALNVALSLAKNTGMALAG